MEKFFKKVDYHYNIRGWLKSINDVVGLQSGSDPQDLFAFKLNYNTVEDPEYGCTSLYNGNIAQAYWRTASDDTQRKYGFVYDDLNRLLFASYTKPLASIYNTGSYDETINYDKNGNITRLQRNGEYDDLIQNLTIDDLVYSYNPTSPNQLVKVDDQTDNPNGFKDGVNTGNDYSYDAYGNMTVDKNKGITLIKYNHLNLPTQITFGTSGNIQYIYNASGVKVRKIVTEGTSVQTTDYLSGFQYLNNTLEFFPHAEGYVKDVTGERSNGSPSTTGVFRYIYNYTDHLGNIRLSYTKDPATNVLTILEENNYYPFGLKHRNYNMTKKSYEKLESTGGIVITPTNETVYDYKYNGVEFQDELGLNMYAMDMRQYDPAISRFISMDVMAEGDADLTPYRFGYNNPVLFSDPTGLWEEVDGGHKTTDKDEIQRIYAFLQSNQNASMEQISSFVKEDIAFMSQYNDGMPLTGLTVVGGKVNEGTLLRTKNEIAYYMGNTNYLYNRADFRKRDLILGHGTNDPISRLLLRREEAGVMFQS